MSTTMSASAEGGRLRRPRWRDPRLLVGLVLVLASIAGVVALVASAQRTAAYWTACLLYTSDAADDQSTV